jgi:GT2 family glycosyltransferase
VDAPCQFLAVTVVYKSAPSQSASLRSLSRCLASGHLITCIVWDNSPHAADQAERAWLGDTLPDSIYRHTPENVPLSRIYNTIIGEFLRPVPGSTFDALLITDQDSLFDPVLLDEAGAAMSAHRDVALFLPHVIANDTIVSPATVYGCIGRPWRRKRVGKMNARSRTAINSGMIIRSDYLARRFPGYDERLRFYGTDNDFCRKYSRTEKWMYTLNSVVTHSLSRDVDEISDVRLSRHRENVRALLITNTTGWFTRGLVLCYCRLYCVKRAIIERDARFLRWDESDTN